MRRHWVVFCVGLGFLAGMASAPITGAVEGPAGKGLFSGLKAGRSVGLKDVGAAYEITVMGDEPLGHEVVEVGTDYLVLRDVAGWTETRIPVSSIKSVTRVVLPGR